jgi:hypothetical protein
MQSFVSVPELSNWKSSDIIIEPSTTTAKLIIPRSIFKSDVGKVHKILLLVAEVVSNANLQ